ncbi:LysR family transcriptional regulator [Microbacterium sp.]|uniref:LysR family transcriptional regulator n=1 Tax=Microbacterium sp. TaxID=51671 RepID=UPI003A92BB15
MNLKRLPSPNDLLILLTVARLGRFNAVAEALGTTHTTISRRILALDRELGGRTLERSPHGWELTRLGAQAVNAAEAIEDKLALLAGSISHDEGSLSGLVRISTVDGFGTRFVTPALVRLQQQHPNIDVELFSATRKVNQNRSGVDIEVVAGWTETVSAHRIHLTDYLLRLYASRAYLDARGTPTSVNDLLHHGFVSYVESVLQVAELGQRSLNLPTLSTSFQATSIFAQNEAVRNGAGIGLLANFMVDWDPDFLPVLATEFQRKLPMWAVVRPEALRSPVAEAAVRAIQREVAERQDELTG